MASIIPNRKPDTPMQLLFATGSYQSKIELPSFRKQAAFPGAASSIFERNKRPMEEVNIKPITQSKPPLECFNPKHYLTPFKPESTHRDVSMNSLHSTRIFNRKLAAMQEQSKPQAAPSKEVSKSDFTELKKYSSQHIFPNNTQRVMSMAESHNYISQNENQFYKNTKIFYKPSTSYNKYQFSTPDYFRTDEKKLEMTKTGSNAFKPGETVTVISRNNGWLTVDPMTFSRKNAFEKRVKGNLHKTSHMSPSWMHTEAQRDETQLKSFKPLTVKRQNLRCESNRLFLVDRVEPPKSIFNLGQVRHNVLTKDEAQRCFSTQRNSSSQPARLIEWNEAPMKQTYDTKRLTGKIGHE